MFKSLYAKRDPELELKRYEREIKFWPQGLNGGTTVNGVLLTGVPESGYTHTMNPFTTTAPAFYSYQEFDDTEGREGHKMTLVRMDYMVTIKPKWLKAAKGATIFWCLVQQKSRTPDMPVGPDNGCYPTFGQLGAGPQFRQLFDIDFEDMKDGKWPPLRNSTFRKQFKILKRGKWKGLPTQNVISYAGGVVDLVAPLYKTDLRIDLPGDYATTTHNTTKIVRYNGTTTDSAGTSLPLIYENPAGVSKWAVQTYTTKGSIKSRSMLTWFKESDFSDVNQVPPTGHTGQQEWTKNNHIYFCCWSRDGEANETSTYPPAIGDQHEVTVRYRMTFMDA